MKHFIICFCFYAGCFTPVRGQHLSFTSFFDEADTFVRHHSPTEGLNYIDSLLVAYPDKTSQQTLKTTKLFPLVQAEMYDVTL